MLLFSDGAGGLVDLTGSAAPPAFSSDRGFDETVDAGTTADYFVDGSISPSGTTYQTVTAAVAQAVTDGVSRTIAVKDTATYRELVDLDGFQGRITGYGTDKPLITGQEPLTGWTQCDSGDESRVGANYANIYKKTINTSAIVALASLNIYEAGAPVPICQTQQEGADLFYPTYDKTFRLADSFTLDGSNKITAITDADVLAGLTSAQLVGRAEVVVYRNPNATSRVNITAFSGSTIDIDGLPLVQGNTASPDPSVLKWNLVNCLPKLSQGTYGTWDNGDSTITVYIWPTDTANLTGDVTYGAREGIIEIPEGNSNITLENLKLLGVAGSGAISGYAISVGNNNVDSSNITIENCLVGEGSGIGGYGSIIVRRTNNVEIRNVTMRYVTGSWGIYIAGGSGDTTSDGVIVSHCLLSDIAGAATRFALANDVQCVFNDYYNTGKSAHANSWNVYQGSNNFLFYGNFLHETAGFGTWQGTSNVFVGCNVQQTGIEENASIALQDQNKPTNGVPTQPDPGCTNYVWNNDFPPHLSNLGASSVDLAKPWEDSPYYAGADADHPNNARYVFINNVCHGGGVYEPYRQIPIGNAAWQQHWGEREGYDDLYTEQQRDGNLYTAIAFWQTASAPYGWILGANETVETDLDVVYVDYTAYDFRAAPGSPLLTKTGVDLAGTIAAASAIWPSFDFTKDRDGNTINTTTPKIGALHGDRNAQTLAMWT